MSETTKPTAARRRDTMVDVYIESVPAPLHRALSQAADEQAMSMNGVAVLAIAEEFGVAYDPPGRRSAGRKSERSTLYLTMPRRLRQKLNEQRAKTDVPVSEIVVAILARRFL